MSDILFSKNGGSEDVETLSKALEISVEPYQGSLDNFEQTRRFFDLTAFIVERELFLQIGVVGVDLPDDYRVRILVSRGDKAFVLGFSRERVSASNPHQLIVNMLIFGALFTLIAFIYLRNQLRPITRLANAAESFGLGRSVEYKPSGAVEVRAAGRAFLDMRARIERHIEQRTLLLSGVSHDLRTPLTRLRLGLAMLEHEDKDALEKDVTEMQALIDEFLSFTRGQAEVEAHRERLDIWQLVDDVVRQANVHTDRLVFSRPEAPLIMDIRPLSIRRAINNLVSNGLRYAIRVRISGNIKQKTVQIHVEDDGPGIPEDKVKDALKPFERLDAARNQNFGTGAGLGLPIVADIAHAHGGQLVLSRSETLGGLRATFSLGLRK